jgi:hypothetical protein
MKVSVKYGMKKLPLLSHSAASFLVKYDIFWKGQGRRVSSRK